MYLWPEELYKHTLTFSPRTPEVESAMAAARSEVICILYRKYIMVPVVNIVEG
jgi:hypothetical protein